MLKNKNIIVRISVVSAFMFMALLCASEVYAQTPACVSPLVSASSIPGAAPGTTGCVYPIVALSTLPGLTTAGQQTSPTAYIEGLYAFAIGIGAVIAVVSGVYAGIEYMLSETSFTSVSKAKERMWNVLWGAILLFCSYILLSIINPQLVNWNLNLGTINTSALQADITTNNAALAAQQAQAQYIALSGAINTSIATANNAIQSLASAQSVLTDAQANLDNLAGDSDPNNQCASATYANANPNICGPIVQAQAAVTAAQAAVITQQATASGDQVSVISNQAGAGINAAMNDFFQQKQSLQTSQNIINNPESVTSFVNGDAINVRNNISQSQTAMTTDVQAVTNLITGANIKLGTLITQATQENNPALATQLTQSKATLDQQWQAYLTQMK